MSRWIADPQLRRAPSLAVLASKIILVEAVDGRDSESTEQGRRMHNNRAWSI